MTAQWLEVLAAFMLFWGKASTIRCYACMGTQPGCSVDKLDWRLVKNTECPDTQDVCVKIIENMLGTYLTTRGCLSTITSLRRDIPGDHYEGCRGGAEDVRYNKDVNAIHPHQTSVSTDDVTFCFCAWDNYCNVGYSSIRASIRLGLLYSTFLISRLFML